MASKTITLTSTPQLLARGAGHRGSRRNVSVQVKGATGIVAGDADSQDYTVASGVIEDFTKGAGDNLWAKSTGADTEVELSFDIKTISDVEEVLRSGAPAGQHKARWYSTRNPANTGQLISEKFKPGITAQLGSTTGSDTNDPTAGTSNSRAHLAHDGVDDYTQLVARDSIYFTKISGKATGLLCFRKTVANASGLNRLVSYESAADDGLYIGITAADVVGVYAGDGTTVTAVAAATYSTSDIEVVGFGVNDGSLYGYQHGTGYSAATALSGITADPTFGVGRIGCQAFAVDNAEDFDLYDYIVIPDVYLEEWEADTLAAHLKTGDF